MADNTFGKQGWTPERIGSLDGKVFVSTECLGFSDGLSLGL